MTRLDSDRGHVVIRCVHGDIKSWSMDSNCFSKILVAVKSSLGPVSKCLGLTTLFSIWKGLVGMNTE